MNGHADFLRAAFPQTQRWYLRHTLPLQVGDAVKALFAPLHAALDALKQVAGK